MTMYSVTCIPLVFRLSQLKAGQMGPLNGWTFNQIFDKKHFSCNPRKKWTKFVRATAFPFPESERCWGWSSVLVLVVETEGLSDLIPPQASAKWNFMNNSVCRLTHRLQKIAFLHHLISNAQVLTKSIAETGTDVSFGNHLRAKSKSGWWLNQPIWKNLSQIGFIFPNFRGEHLKNETTT